MAETRLRHGRLTAEAFFWLLLAGAGLRVLPFSRLAGLAARPAGQSTPQDALAAARAIGRAVEAASRHAPWSVRCFERGLAAHAMLRLRGCASVLCYGGRSEASNGVAAHVWVRMGEFCVVGGEQSARFGLLARFPPGEPDNGAKA